MHCTAYVLKLPQSSKFEQKPLEGVYLESLDYGVYRVLVKENESGYRLVESRHVTFDESRFLGVSYLEDYIDHDSDKSFAHHEYDDSLSESTLDDSA